MNQEQIATIRAAEGLARRERWPAGLLSAVQLAVSEADPWGPDSWRGQGERWEAIGEALHDVAASRPDDIGRLAELFKIVQSGATIQDSPADVAGDAAADLAQGVAGDIGGGLKAGAELARLALPLGLLAAGLYLWTRAR